MRTLLEVIEGRYQLVKYAAWTYEVESRRCVLLNESPMEMGTDAAWDHPGRVDNSVSVESQLKASIGNVTGENTGA